MRAITDCRFFMLDSKDFAEAMRIVVPDGDAHARGPLPGDPELQPDRPAAPAPAVARHSDRRADARAQQPGRRGVARLAGAEAAGRRHAAEAGQARARGDRPAAARGAGRGAGGSGAGHRDGAEADRAGGVRARGRARRVARGPQHRARLGHRADLRRCGYDAGVPGEGRRRCTGRAVRRDGLLARVHAGDRAADRRGHRLRHPDHESRRCRPAVLAHGPRSRSSAPTSTSA